MDRGAICPRLHIKPTLLELAKPCASMINRRAYALSVWREPPFFTPAERAALAWTEVVTEVSAGHASDEIYRLAREHLDERQLVDLTMVIIAINSWNRLAIAFRAIAGTYEPAKQHSAGSEVSP